jgi:hypothetical protein
MKQVCTERIWYHQAPCNARGPVKSLEFEPGGLKGDHDCHVSKPSCVFLHCLFQFFFVCLHRRRRTHPTPNCRHRRYLIDNCIRYSNPSSRPYFKPSIFSTGDSPIRRSSHSSFRPWPRCTTVIFSFYTNHVRFICSPISSLARILANRETIRKTLSLYDSLYEVESFDIYITHPFTHLLKFPSKSDPLLLQIYQALGCVVILISLRSL